LHRDKRDARATGAIRSCSGVPLVKEKKMRTLSQERVRAIPNDFLLCR
jgi:hypothetical protein